jgi:hypothetical protein
MLAYYHMQMRSGEATNTNFIVFGLTRSELEPTIYNTGGKHANHYTTGFSAKHAALWRKSKDWMTRNQDNMSTWGDMSICGLLFQ